MSNIVDQFEPSMAALDAMIKKLETNLGKKHSVSPFDDIRKKYGGKTAVVVQEAPKEEVKQEAPAKAEKKPKEKKEKVANAPAKAEPAGNLTTELEWFNNCDLRVGKIVECVPCEGSDKLYIEKIDLGEGQLREIGSGVQQHIKLEEMLRPDAFVVVFANLKPRKLAHIMSQGMVMCASNAEHTEIELIRPPAGSKVGERVNLQGNPISGFSQDKQEELKPKKKYMENLLTKTRSNGALEACFDGIPMVTSAGVIKVSKLANCGIS
jgi:methionine--tRNA ligase beta chain